MQIHRLLELVIILLNRKTITAKELAERFDVSTRTIYRDVDVLSSAGVPVFTNKGNGGGISLLEDFSLNKTLISHQERESLLLALATLKATKYPEIDSILEKIGAVFKNADTTNWVQIDFSHWGSKLNEQNKFAEIKKAILQRIPLSMDYVNSAGENSRRSIEPMQLVFKGQAWYLWGYCRSKNNFRLFRISRIKNVSLTNASFERRAFNASDQQNQDKDLRPPVRLKLRFCPEVLYRVYDDFDSDLFTKNADGTCDVTVTFPEDEWVYGYILSFGSYVRVLEPKEVRDIIIGRMSRALQSYNS